VRAAAGRRPASASGCQNLAHQGAPPHRPRWASSFGNGKPAAMAARYPAALIRSGCVPVAEAGAPVLFIIRTTGRLLVRTTGVVTMHFSVRRKGPDRQAGDHQVHPGQ